MRISGRSAEVTHRDPLLEKLNRSTVVFLQDTNNVSHTNTCYPICPCSDSVPFDGTFDGEAVAGKDVEK